MRVRHCYVAALAVISLITVMPLMTARTQVIDGVPSLINYQGRLSDADGDPVADGEYLVTFTIWTDPESTAPGDRRWISVDCPVLVVNGLFNYRLGSRENLPPWTISNYVNLWLGIRVGEDPELSPRTRLCSAPFAYKAWQADWAEYADSAGTLAGGGPPPITRACANIETHTAGAFTGPPTALDHQIKIDFPVTFQNGANVDLSASAIVTSGTGAGFPARITVSSVTETYAILSLEGWNGASYENLQNGDEVQVAYTAIER